MSAPSTSAPVATPGPPSRRRRRFIAVSTKMYFSLARTAAYVSSLLTALSSSSSSSPSSAHSLLSALDMDVVLIPDFLSLPATRAAIAHRHEAAQRPPPTPAPPARAAGGGDSGGGGLRLLVGAQDCAANASFGPFTGEVSPAALRELGCAVVEVGHAERRRLLGETDEVVAQKARAVVRNGMCPLVCVGEERAPSTTGGGGQGRGDGPDGDGQRGLVERVIDAAAAEVLRQAEAVLKGLPDEAEVVLAYEPVWAIGAAEPASAEHVRGVVSRVRECDVVKGRTGTTRIVYGGAAGPGLWKRLGGEVDGLFLGRFAHDPEQFVKMLYEVAEVDASGEVAPREWT